VCAGCGAVTWLACPQCGFRNLPQARFCGQCAGAITARGVDGRGEAARRHLTVMFCDLVGSTGLAQELDPEDLREVIQEYQTTCAGIVRRLDGHVAQFLGDGVLVYFGYPAAHEDDARRAVGAGLEILRAIGKLYARSRRLRARIGIHTGLVVVGSVGAGGQRQQLAMGEAPNLAARVQAKAKPNCLVVSESTYRLVHGFFKCEDLGEHSLKGLSQATHLYRVLSESGASSRLDAARATGLTPFVGRRDELNLLLDSWGSVARGQARIVAVRGEAGIGKSRLIDVLKEQIGQARDVRDVIECRCSPYHQNSALYPVIAFLERHLGLGRSASPEQRLASLEAMTAGLGAWSHQALPLLASLLSVPLPPHMPPLEMSPQKRRQRTLELLVEWLGKLSAQRPVLFILEDLHWADPTTLDLARLLVEGDPTSERSPPTRIMICLTSRPEFRMSWGKPLVLIELNLRPLAETAVTSMVEHVAGKALPGDVTAQLYAKTGGIPLFVEETTKAVIEANVLLPKEDCYELVGPLPANLIPPTVQGSLMARLDGLGESKRLAQLAATLGREFRYDVLRAVWEADDDALQTDLRRLVDSELVFQEGKPPSATYSFKHALIRDAAYESLLRRTRQQYHQEIAHTLISQFPEVSAAEPELVATHFEGAGITSQAVAYWKRAGELALGRAANREAIAHLQHTLALLESLPVTDERAALELDVQLGLAPALMAIKGWASPEVERACVRARDLAMRTDSGPQIFHALWGLWTVHFLRGDLIAALDVAERVHQMAVASENPMLRVMGHHAVGFTLFFQGDFVGAREHAESGIALYSPSQERAIVNAAQFSSTVALRVFRAASLWMLGQPSEARLELERAGALAGELHHAPSTAFYLSFAVYLEFYQRDLGGTRAVAEKMLELSKDEGFLLWIPVATIYRGWARAQGGELDDGIAEMHEALQAFEATGSSLTRVQILTGLAEVLAKAGRRDDALASIERALADAAGRGEHLYEPELHRLRGELYAETAGRPEGSHAETSLAEAVALAHAQSAQALEARAAASLEQLRRASTGAATRGVPQAQLTN
jgi:class 3 adenylate cyclase/predicted ATPase